MIFDQPGDIGGLRLVKPEPGAQFSRHRDAGQRMILHPALGDVVQEHRDVEHGAVGDRRQHLLRQRMLDQAAPALDVGEDADRADQVLVHRIRMVHIELHQRDDAAELGNEAAEHAGLVHEPQHHCWRAVRGQDRKEEPVGLGIEAHGGVDPCQAHRHEPHRVGVDRQPALVRHGEEADEVDRIAGEDRRIGEGDAGVLDHEVLGGEHLLAPPHAAEEAIEHRRGLGLALLQRGADDGGEVAHLLGDEEVVLHEALDAVEPGPGAVAQLFGEDALEVEREPLLGAAGLEVKVAAHPPQELLAAQEQPVFLAREQTGLDELGRIAHAVDVFRDPEQSVEVAQSALGILNVGLDEIAAAPGLAHAGVALGQLGATNSAGVSRTTSRSKPLAHVLEEVAIAEDEARLEQRGANRHVLARIGEALLDRACGMPDLLAQIPKRVEHRFDGLKRPGIVFAGQQEEQVDVGAGRQRAAAISTHRRHDETALHILHRG